MITGCPLRQIPQDVFDAMEIARFWKLGIPPTTIGGAGFIDQTENIIRTCTVIWNEQDKWRDHHARQGRIDLDDLH